MAIIVNLSNPPEVTGIPAEASLSWVSSRMMGDASASDPAHLEDRAFALACVISADIGEAVTLDTGASRFAISPVEAGTHLDRMNWPEDAYIHQRCDICFGPFLGPKRQSVCLLCDQKHLSRKRPSAMISFPEAVHVTEADIPNGIPVIAVAYLAGTRRVGAILVGRMTAGETVAVHEAAGGVLMTPCETGQKDFLGFAMHETGLRLTGTPLKDPETCPSGRAVLIRHGDQVMVAVRRDDGFFAPVPEGSLVGTDAVEGWADISEGIAL